MTHRKPMFQRVSSLTASLKLQDKKLRAQAATLAKASDTGKAPRNDLLPNLEVVYIPVNELRAPKLAVRKLDPAHVREIAASIGTFGFSDPILLGENNVMVDGVATFEAAKLRRLEEVPCIRVSHLTPEEQKKFRIAINRLGEKGGWDLPQLKLQLEEIRLDDPEIEIPGLSTDEIDQILIGDEEDAVESGPCEPESNAVAITEFGDVFQLGPHVVVCGDSTVESTLAQLMRRDNGSHESARALFTDPPYNVEIVGNVTRSRKHREFAMATGEMTDEQFQGFHGKWMACSLPYVCDGGILASFIDWRGIRGLLNAAAGQDLNLLNMVVWSKTNPGMGSLYRSHYELFPLLKKGNAAHVNNVELGRRGRSRSNVWTCAGASSLGSDARRGLEDHPTVKPVELLKGALLDLTRRGEIVIDPFLGSGSTLIAAHKTGRICRGVEYDALYVDVVIRRFEAETGEVARLVSTGETFAELAARRAAERAQAAEKEPVEPTKLKVRRRRQRPVNANP